MPGRLGIHQLARKQAKRMQDKMAAQHVSDHCMKLVETDRFADKAAIRACTDQEVRDDFLNTVADQMTPAMLKKKLEITRGTH